MEREYMKLKGKRIKDSNNKIQLPLIAFLFLCICFFFTGFYGSILLSHSQDARGNRSSRRVLESVEELNDSNNDHAPMPHGQSLVASIPFQVFSWKPRAVYFPNFATATQCQNIIEMAKSNLQPSTLSLRKGETVESTKGVRTSSGTFISASEDETGVLDFIEEKIERATMIPRNHGEAFNVLRYEIGQRYLSHLDAFDPAEYGPQKSQRLATFLLYLSDVEKGGETAFPFENGFKVGTGYDYEKCTGLKVKPRQGDGLLFYSLFPNGTIDPTSFHASCPVILGEKWVVTKWIRDQVEAY